MRFYVGRGVHALVLIWIAVCLQKKELCVAAGCFGVCVRVQTFVSQQSLLF